MSEASGLAAARRRLVDGLTILDPNLRHALLSVPRHEFVPSVRVAEAYLDEALPLGPSGATVSAPHMVVLLAEALSPQPGERVLDLGGGMGYLAAVLAELVGPRGHIDCVEIEPDLAAEARRRLDEHGYGRRVRVWNRDGLSGLPEAGPFDRIVVSFATPEIYDVWKLQLVDGGRIVAPMGGSFAQELVTFTRHGSGGRTSVGPGCRFVSAKTRLPAPI